MIPKKNHDDLLVVTKSLDYQEMIGNRTNKVNSLVPKRIIINHTYATRVEAVAELLAIRTKTNITYYFQVGGSCSVRL